MTGTLRRDKVIPPLVLGGALAVVLDGQPGRAGLGDARPDGASCQHAEEPLEVFPEPGGMLRPHQVDRVDAGALAAKQPLQQRLEILARQPHQDGERATLRLHARRVAIGAKQAAALERRERPAIAVLADVVEDAVEPARQDAREVFALVVDRRGGELADERRVLAARGADPGETASMAYARWTLVHLFLVTCIPFSTMVVGRYGNLTPAVCLYAGNMLLAAVVAFRLGSQAMLRNAASERAWRTDLIAVIVVSVLVIALSFYIRANALWLYLLTAVTPLLRWHKRQAD